MVGIAISSIDPVLRSSLEQLLRDEPAITLVGSVDSPSALLGLADKHHIDVVVADAPPREQLADWQVRRKGTAWVVILDRAEEESGLDALSAGASAILPRFADPKELGSRLIRSTIRELRPDIERTNSFAPACHSASQYA